MIESYRELFARTLNFLKGKERILFLTTSNRWVGEGAEMAKSSLLALKLAEKIGGGKVKIIDVTKLKIYPCEGNISSAMGNSCGLKKAVLEDKEKNPSGYHRCWASINNVDDELWRVSKELFKADTVMFFGSVRWGQMNSFYQKLIERLTWIENRHSTLGEDNVIKNIDAGVIVIGQNWNGENVLKTQKDVLGFYGFSVKDELCWSWQFTDLVEQESSESYLEAGKLFQKTFLD